MQIIHSVPKGWMKVPLAARLASTHVPSQGPDRVGSGSRRYRPRRVYVGFH